METSVGTTQFKLLMAATQLQQLVQIMTGSMNMRATAILVCLSRPILMEVYNGKKDLLMIQSFS